MTVNPLEKPFLGAKDFVEIFGKDCCSMSRAYKLIHELQEETDENGNKLFEQSRCPRNNVIPRHVFIEKFYINVKPRRKI